MNVLVNQLGYEVGSRPTVVLRGTETDDPGTARLETADGGEIAATTEASLAGHVDDWRDWEFWTVEFRAPEEPGEYVVAVDTEDGIARSRRFTVGEQLLRREAIPDLLSYFRVERCTGPYDRADREVSFAGDRDDAVDVRGGWYDASGDVSKYLSHLNYANYMNPQQIPLVAWSLLDAGERIDEGDPLGATLADAAREEARFGADFLVRAQDDAGYFYVTVFDGWTGDPEEREICAFEGFDGERTPEYEAGFRQGGGVAIAALARASEVVRERSAGAGSNGEADAKTVRDGDFDAETYLDAAVTGFEHLQKHNLEYLDDGAENILDDYCALLAATELAGATGERRYADAAADRARSILDRQTDAGWFAADDAGERPFVHATDEGLPIVALCRFLAVLDDADGLDVDDSLRADVHDAVASYWQFELDLTDAVVNPFGYARQYARGVEDAEPRARFFMPQDNETGYWWTGENARLGSLASAALVTEELLAAETPSATEWPHQDDLRSFAHDQLDWILGRNPFDTSMFQGVGSNPQPFMPSEPQTPGGIVNGATVGVEDDSDVAFLPEDYATDYNHTWRWTEQWLPHAAWFLFAATRAAE